MLIGEYQHSLDTKGRLAVPAKFRSELGSSAIVTKGLDSCLFLYPKGEWEVMANKLAHLPMSNFGARAFSRMMLSGAMEVEIDKQGRALLPGYLREFANLKTEVVTSGVMTRVEIWDKQAWKDYTKSSEATASQNVEGLSDWEI
jgi:MraZ protein